MNTALEQALSRYYQAEEAACRIPDPSLIRAMQESAVVAPTMQKPTIHASTKSAPRFQLPSIPKYLWEIAASCAAIVLAVAILFPILFQSQPPIVIQNDPFGPLTAVDGLPQWYSPGTLRITTTTLRYGKQTASTSIRKLSSRQSITPEAASVLDMPEWVTGAHVKNSRYAALTYNEAAGGIGALPFYDLTEKKAFSLAERIFEADPSVFGGKIPTSSSLSGMTFTSDPDLCFIKLRQDGVYLPYLVQVSTGQATALPEGSEYLALSPDSSTLLLAEQTESGESVILYAPLSGTRTELLSTEQGDLSPGTGSYFTPDGRYAVIYTCPSTGKAIHPESTAATWVLYDMQEGTKAAGTGKIIRFPAQGGAVIVKTASGAQVLSTADLSPMPESYPLLRSEQYELTAYPAGDAEGLKLIPLFDQGEEIILSDGYSARAQWGDYLFLYEQDENRIVLYSHKHNQFVAIRLGALDLTQAAELSLTVTPDGEHCELVVTVDREMVGETETRTETSGGIETETMPPIGTEIDVKATPSFEAHRIPTQSYDRQNPNKAHLIRTYDALVPLIDYYTQYTKESPDLPETQNASMPFEQYPKTFFQSNALLLLECDSRASLDCKLELTLTRAYIKDGTLYLDVTSDQMIMRNTSFCLQAFVIPKKDLSGLTNTSPVLNETVGTRFDASFEANLIHTPYKSVADLDYSINRINQTGQFLRTWEEMNAFLAEMNEKCLPDVSIKGAERYDTYLAQFDEAWFETRQLAIYEFSTNFRYRGTFLEEFRFPKVTSIDLTETALNLTVQNTPCRKDSAILHIIVEMPKMEGLDSANIKIEAVPDKPSGGTTLAANPDRADSREAQSLQADRVQSVYVKMDRDDGAQGPVPGGRLYTDYASFHSWTEWLNTFDWGEGSGDTCYDPDSTLNGLPSYNDWVEKYSEAWFRDNVLLCIETRDSSGGTVAQKSPLPWWQVDEPVPAPTLTGLTVLDNALVYTMDIPYVSEHTILIGEGERPFGNGSYLYCTFVELSRDGIERLDEIQSAYCYSAMLSEDWENFGYETNDDTIAGGGVLTEKDTEVPFYAHPVYTPVKERPSYEDGYYMNALTLPDYACRSMSDLAALEKYLDEICYADGTLDGVMRYDEYLSRYDAAWFEDWVLLAVPVSSNQGFNGSLRNTLTPPRVTAVVGDIHKGGNGITTARFTVRTENIPCRYESAVFYLFVEVPCLLLPSSVDQIQTNAVVTCTAENEEPLARAPEPSGRPDSWPIVLLDTFSWDGALEPIDNGYVGQFGTSVSYYTRYQSMASDIQTAGASSYFYDHSYSEHGLLTINELCERFYPEWFEENAVIRIMAGAEEATARVSGVAAVDGRLHVFFDTAESKSVSTFGNGYVYLRVPKEFLAHIDRDVARNFALHDNVLATETRTGGIEIGERPSDSGYTETYVPAQFSGTDCYTLTASFLEIDENGNEIVSCYLNNGMNLIPLRDIGHLIEEIPEKGYYWLTMDPDFVGYVKELYVEQRYVFLQDAIAKFGAACLSEIRPREEGEKEDFTPIRAEGDAIEKCRRPAVAEGHFTAKLLSLEHMDLQSSKEPVKPLAHFETASGEHFYVCFHALTPPDLEPSQIYTVTLTASPILYAPEELIGQPLTVDQIEPYVNWPMVECREATEDEIAKGEVSLTLRAE